MDSFKGLRSCAIFAARRCQPAGRESGNSGRYLRSVSRLELFPIFSRGAGASEIPEWRYRYPRAGPMMSAYHRFNSRVAAEDKEQSFFDGIDTSLAGIASLAKQGETTFLVD